ncbi:bifunctional diguanylate cyclase/phosphodiesterase [Alisedimentitalea sp. MJ-SS2]|uniref:putative bifunctional diguanylate cyclase/phosphodiesterase n=1 Tax=Aliisedimentitalea sp. MJ-SS2 TaxID=3049795 RepID=UPI00290DA292|nr:bifunctional diguanylate cyclase/phosphodiesterase [Alisedimentitalea sp. MJ-SS2]MDU8928431.1 bifunctional diguanylate cyclase/phosphodiesterase [Alisedimentitalea sp. MJ-SS2]
MGLRNGDFRDKTLVTSGRTVLHRLLGGPQALALLPALALGAYWTAGETGLVVVALGIPLLVLLVGDIDPPLAGITGPIDMVTGLPLADTIEERLEIALTQAQTRGLKTGCLLLRIEDFATFIDRQGATAGDQVLEKCAALLRGALRDGDHLAWMGQGTFGVAFKAVPNLDLEVAIQLSSRLQTTLEEPIALAGGTVYLSAGIGFCLSTRSPEKTGRGMIKGAQIALDEALRAGPSAIRVYSQEMGHVRESRETLRDDALMALENGEIAPWFQPQISTDTGRVTGFEALARWIHPQRGIVPPGEFLPFLERADQMERLGEIILYGALKAVTAWDSAEVTVPCVAVNFTGKELRNPKLADKIGWDLDRFDLTADRLTIEVLETVVIGSPEDTAARNITALAAMGCRIDLDDFGTGYASISAIRRFAIERIKIDRSFITHVDQDPEQQRMVSAILSMADRLGLETLAEGVETAGEHAMLAQLGCRHVQGFGIARPMPFDQTIDWITRHEAKLAQAPSIGRKSG